MIQEMLWMWRGPIKSSLAPRNLLLTWRKELAVWRRFWRSYQQYKQLMPSDRERLLENLYPCLGEDTIETLIEPTYFYQDSWAFEKIIGNHPDHHIDVGSHHKFVALLSKVLPVTMVDIRPLSLPLDTLKFRQGSILELPFENSSVESLSSLCVVEHIGLGRYGDPLDYRGTEKAIEELKRVMKPGGNLYISLPLDDENRTYFNAHRAFKEDYLLRLFHPFKIIESRYIYGREFGDQLGVGFGTGCYHLKRVE